MRSMLLQFRRAPGRIIVSVLALALAVAAVGVLAIPTVSESTLHAAVGRDGLADVIANTTTLDATALDAVRGIDGVAAAEAQVATSVVLADGTQVRLVGLDFDGQTMDRVQLVTGRLPTSPHEVIAPARLGEAGRTLVAGSRRYEVVGQGETLWWTGEDVLYVPLEGLVAESGGFNRIVVTAHDDGSESLRSIVDGMRRVIEAEGGTFTTLPIYLPDGSTPIDRDIEQVSMLIGLLGVFAGLVALVLLASTANTLITERTREAAVMRALGGRQRLLQRRLRRLAVAIAAMALVIGLPLGVLISNVIARMVLEEFVGITPDFAVDWRVLVGSAVATLVGARLVAGRAARRVVRVPLAEALRDREGIPFGHRRAHRWLARVAPGGLGARLAFRSMLRRPGRTVAVVVQVSAAVGAAFMVPSLATSVNAYNSATQDPWSWESVTHASDPGLPIAQSIEDRSPGLEAGIWTDGEVDGWELEVFGLAVDTRLFDPRLRGSASRWVAAGERQAVVSAGFADRTGYSVGDDIVVELATGAERYRVVGLSDDAARAIYVDRDVLAADLGAPERADTVWAAPGSPAPRLDLASDTTTAVDLAAEDKAGREAIVLIFGAIGVIVAGVAALAVSSTMTVNLYERRHEMATMQALGARRRRLRLSVVRELAPLAGAGIAGGLALGALGTRGIIASFEASNAVDIGVVDAVASVPAIVVATAATVIVLTLGVVRIVARRPVAATLRAAA